MMISVMLAVLLQSPVAISNPAILPTFSPGVAILGPKKHFGLETYGGSAMQNCWSNDEVANAHSRLDVTVLKVGFGDGTTWVNPTPGEPLASVTY